MNPLTTPLLTDLYQLTMLQAYVDQEMHAPATFEFFVRKLPAQRNFLLACGLEQVLEFLAQLHFGDEELAWIARHGAFHGRFVEFLRQLRFTGDVDAMPEGTVFFPDEPILRVTAPLPVAQLVETRIINLLQFQTLVASKAVRSVLAAPGKLLVDFGLRRAHGAEAGLLAARAGYIAGLSGTSAVLAAPLFDIPVFGTMAHSFIEAHELENDAFRHFARSLPGSVVLLIDTYDTEAAAAKVVRLAPELRAEGIRIQGVRLDSGDLGDHARKVRHILDAGGLTDVTIFASGNLDEYAVSALLAAGAPIDGFGIGTRLDTSADAPYLDCAYKLQEFAGQARRKRSEGKSTWPGRKQVFRRRDARGCLCGDTLTLEGDTHAGEALLLPVMRAGRRLAPPTPLLRLRAHVAAQLAQLPDDLRGLAAGAPVPVSVAPALRALAESVDRRPV
jgi:nicotinate phosphoribosyltransferase